MARARLPACVAGGGPLLPVALLVAPGFEACAALVADCPVPGLAAAGLEQRERDQVLVQFSNRSCSVLVATDVAARGLDISQLEMVINVDVTPDSEVHIYRIGRTGRADEDGWAISLASMDETGSVGKIELLQKPFPNRTSWMN